MAFTAGYALLVRQGGDEVVAIRLSNGATEPVRFTATSPLDEPLLSVDATGIWLDDPRGQTAVVVTAQGPKLISKIDEDAPRLGKDGKPIAGDEGTRLSSDDATTGAGIDSIDEIPEPDGDGVDDPPVAQDDSASAREGIEVAVIATANDYDPDGDPIAIVEVTSGRSGEVSILDSTTVVYSPAAGTIGTDTFTYTISDPAGQEATAEVSVEMIAADALNRPPIANPDKAETVASRDVVIDVLRNDFDPERTQLSVADITPPETAKGSVERTILPDGRTGLKFTPADGFVGGTATFSYRAGDADNGKSNSAEVTITVAGAGAENRPPVAVPDAARTRVEQSVQIPVLANDTDPDNDLLTITDTKLSDPRRGEVRASGRSILFVPSASAAGLVLIEYTISDGNGGEDIGEVLVVVLPGNQENGPPVAAPDEISAPSRTLVFDPTKNDKDPDNDPLTLVSVTQPNDGGTTAKLSGNQVSFTPVVNRTGTFRFSYVITDGMGHEATGNVAVTILAVRRPDGPTATDDQAETLVNRPVTINVLGNDSDPSGDQLQLDGLPNCQYGTCKVNSDQTITFTPPKDAFSTYRFTYRVRNSVGQTAEATVAVQVQEIPVVNESPVARPDRTEVVRGQTVSISVLANDEDENKDTLEIQRVITPASMSGTADIVNQTIRYTSATTDPLVVTFQYTIEDEEGKTGTATVTVEIVEPANRAPIANEDDRIVTQGDEIPDFDVVANDYDPDGVGETLRLVGEPRRVSGDGAGEPSGHPHDPDRTGAVVRRRDPCAVRDHRPRRPHEHRYLHGDHHGARQRAALGTGRFSPTNQGSAVDVLVLNNDEDPDGDQLTVELTSGPASQQGSAVVRPDRKTVRFTPAAGFSGQATFQYRAVDSKGTKSNTATVRVTVIACAQGTPDHQRHPDLHPVTRQPIALNLLAPGQLDFRLDVTDVQGGQVANGASPGTVIFTPAAGNNDFGSVRYTVTNSCDVSRNGSISIDVNRAPVFVGGSFSADRRHAGDGDCRADREGRRAADDQRGDTVVDRHDRAQRQRAHVQVVGRRTGHGQRDRQGSRWSRGIRDVDVRRPTARQRSADGEERFRDAEPERDRHPSRSM